MDINSNLKSKCFTAGRNHWLPDYVSIHSISESPIELCNIDSENSYHFVIDRDGKVYEMVEHYDTAWSNGNTVVDKDERHYSNSNFFIVRQRKTSANFYTLSVAVVEGNNINKQQSEALRLLLRHVKHLLNEIYGISNYNVSNLILNYSEVPVKSV